MINFKVMSLRSLKSYPSTSLVGGSSASVELIEDRETIQRDYPGSPTNRKLVRKYSSLSNDSSNGTPHVMGEYEQYSSLSPELSDVFPSVFNSGRRTIHGYESFYFDMEYVGQCTPDLIQQGNLSWSDLKSGFQGLWKTLWEHGYSQSLYELSQEERRKEFDEFYIDVLEKRLHTIYGQNLVMEFDSQSLSINNFLDQDHFLINGALYSNPIAVIRSSNGLSDRFAPYVLSDYIHGELNPGNTAFDETGKMRAFDPHPKGGRQQPSYDLGKFMMGLSGFSDIVVGNYDIHYEDYAFNFTLNTPQRSNATFADSFMTMIEIEDDFKELRKSEPNLQDRVKFISLYQLLRDTYYRAQKGEISKIIANVLQSSILFENYFEGSFN